MRVRTQLQGGGPAAPTLDLIDFASGRKYQEGLTRALGLAGPTLPAAPRFARPTPRYTATGSAPAAIASMSSRPQPTRFELPLHVHLDQLVE